MTPKKKTGKTRYLFVTGGVVSSLGKGLASASIGNLLESRGLAVTFLKLDPYINVDPGTMNPYQHGEVYVTDDGAETDLDLGHYERFTSVVMSKKNNTTAGKIYHSVITKERRGDYLGGTVQVVPHVTDEIKHAIRRAANGVDVVIVEVGGTVGDIESLPFLEAIRQFPFDVGRENVLYIHVTLVPFIKTVDELKTKPTQHSVNKLREIGIQPNILLCRTDRPLSQDIKKKIALFSNLEKEAVITARDVDTIYDVPLVFHQEGLDDLIVRHLHLKAKPPVLNNWKELVERIRNPKHKVRIALVGKYIELKESYKSLCEALTHGGLPHHCGVEVMWVDAEEIERKGAEPLLKMADGILVPGGFGNRGIEGKIEAIRYSRESKTPFLGICLGMQCAAIEFGRNVAGLKGANSSEFDPKTRHPVIHLLSSQKNLDDKGGTMRLGAYPCELARGSRAYRAYRTGRVAERHRHRYEFNNNYLETFKKAGMTVSGLYPQEQLVEIIELADHPWFLATQFHPEFRSRPTAPHPVFRDFIQAALETSKNK
ncbi:MAG: CTP synthase [Nitrospirae bacterium]|nr:CTP synthase [Nitrospirota bacterium]